jgi:hypothetical protein
MFICVCLYVYEYMCVLYFLKKVIPAFRIFHIHHIGMTSYWVVVFVLVTDDGKGTRK